MWGGLFAAQNKRYVFLGTTIALAGSATLFYALTAVIPREHAICTSLLTSTLLCASLIGCHYLSGLISPVYDELGIKPASPESFVWRGFGRGRPLANFNNGAAICVILVLFCATSIWSGKLEGFTVCVFFGTCPLLVYALARKAIPRISGIDRSVNLGLGMSALIVIIGIPAAQAIGLAGLTILATVCSVSLINNVALMVPCMHRSAPDACAKIFVNTLIGFLASSLLAFALMSFGASTNVLAETLCGYLVCLTLIEPATAPYESTIVDILHNFANGSDSLDEDLTFITQASSRLHTHPENDPSAHMPHQNAANDANKSPSEASSKTVDVDITSIEQVHLSIAKQYKLTPQETKVLMLLARGHTASRIGEKLYISTNTVKSHTYNLYHKMGIRSKQDLLNLLEEAVGKAREQN